AVGVKDNVGGTRAPSRYLTGARAAAKVRQESVGPTPCPSLSDALFRLLLEKWLAFDARGILSCPRDQGQTQARSVERKQSALQLVTGVQSHTKRCGRRARSGCHSPTQSSSKEHP